MNHPKLGELIPTDEQAFKDAIHIAVCPMISLEELYPGQFIGLDSSGMATEKEKPIGIVDPFLSHTVKPKTRFWMLLFPASITSLRHEWTHPAFDSIKMPPDKQLSEMWLKDAAKTAGVSYFWFTVAH